jgi:hypothetical protein
LRPAGTEVDQVNHVAWVAVAEEDTAGNNGTRVIPRHVHEELAIGEK